MTIFPCHTWANLFLPTCYPSIIEVSEVLQELSHYGYYGISWYIRAPFDPMLAELGHAYLPFILEEQMEFWGAEESDKFISGAN